MGFSWLFLNMAEGYDARASRCCSQVFALCTSSDLKRSIMIHDYN